MPGNGAAGATEIGDEMLACEGTVCHWMDRTSNCETGHELSLPSSDSEVIPSISSIHPSPSPHVLLMAFSA